MRDGAGPDDEVARVAALRALQLLDTLPEERFDRVVRLAQRLFGVPIALVSLVDEHRQWFKARVGLEASETPRDVAFCGHAIEGDAVFQVADATQDPRFAGNPLVLDDPAIRFYAGCPIIGPTGHKLGTLCIIDRHPRRLTDDEVAGLRDLADVVESELATTLLATTDELTGLANRRGFLATAPKLLEACAIAGVEATLALCDLDGFKGINDRWGHDVGDLALQVFAELLAEAFPDAALVGRLGGDEFAVLLTGWSPDAAARLDATLDARNRTAAHPFRLSSSVGTASTTVDDPAPLADLLVAADEAMYADKFGSAAS